MQHRLSFFAYLVCAAVILGAGLLYYPKWNKDQSTTLSPASTPPKNQPPASLLPEPFAAKDANTRAPQQVSATPGKTPVGTGYFLPKATPTHILISLMQLVFFAVPFPFFRFLTPQRSDAAMYWNGCGSPVAYLAAMGITDDHELVRKKVLSPYSTQGSLL